MDGIDSKACSDSLGLRGPPWLDQYPAQNPTQNPGQFTKKPEAQKAQKGEARAISSDHARIKCGKKKLNCPSN